MQQQQQQQLQLQHQNKIKIFYLKEGRGESYTQRFVTLLLPNA